TRIRLASLSHSRDLPSSLSMYLTLSRDLERRRSSAMLHVMSTFDRNTSLSLGVRHDQSTSAHVHLSRGAPTAAGLGWQFSRTMNEQGNGQTNAALTWNNEYTHIIAGSYGSSGMRTNWGSVRGSLVTMDNSLFASRQIGDAFVLINTHGVA